MYRLFVTWILATHTSAVMQLTHMMHVTRSSITSVQTSTNCLLTTETAAPLCLLFLQIDRCFK